VFPLEICYEQEEKVEHQPDDIVLKDDFNAWYARRMKIKPVVSEIMMLKYPAVVMMYKNGSFKGLPMEAIS
jgi:hypothetical protein